MSRRVGTLVAIAWLLWPSAALASAPDPRFGAVNAFEDPDRADDLGVAWSRLFIGWERVQRTGPQDWWPPIDDDLVTQEARRGRKMVGVLINTPPWAATNTTRPYASPPKNLALPAGDPENYWGAFVRRAAAAYRGRIDTWVVWNEPDVWDPAHPGYTWSGTDDELYRLQKVAYQAARLGNPEAKVLLPGITYFWDRRGERQPFIRRYLEVAKRDAEASANSWFFDAAVLQLYNDPQQLYAAPTEYRAIMKELGADHPVWVNETNVAPWDDLDRPLTRTHYRANQAEQASYFIQGYALAIAAGVERIAAYKMKDDPTWQYGWESYGVERVDRTPRLAFGALRMIHWLYAGATGAGVQRPEGATAVTLRKPDERLVVIWATKPEGASFRLRAIGDAATIHRRDGSSATVFPGDGWYSFELAGATHNTVADHPDVYQIGGAPLVVVERGQTTAATEVTARAGGALEASPVAGVVARSIETLHRASALLRAR